VRAGGERKGGEGNPRAKLLATALNTVFRLMCSSNTLTTGRKTTEVLNLTRCLTVPEGNYDCSKNSFFDDCWRRPCRTNRHSFDVTSPSH